ncbi:MAG: molybdenum ABC transporter permease, partial [Synergistetes bacterium]|nr:molybdenum ABC transporter permease [Synergistota bacterium]
SGVIMSWARGISEFGAVLIIAYHPMVAPVLIYERFEAYGLEYSTPISTLLIVVIFTLFILLRFVFSGKRSSP